MKYIYFMLVALFFAAALDTNAQAIIDINIVAEKEKYSAETPVDLEVRLTNVSSKQVRILDFYTPAGGVKDDIMLVSLEDKLADYIGPHYRRGEPVEEDYITLNPGQSVFGIVSLWDNYDISISGRYMIQYNTAVFSQQPESLNITDVASNTISIYIEGRAPHPEPENDGGEDWIVNGNTQYQSCSSNEINLLAQAREHALNYADDSYDYLLLTSPGSRYTTWFGAYDFVRDLTLRARFRLIRDRMDNDTLKFKCNCNQNAYAWVLPTQSQNIHICKYFWTAPMTGINSKAGTLIHETSHFIVNGGAQDIAYGTTKAQNLAITDPFKAIRNADNIAYFAETTPYNPYNPCAPPVHMYNNTLLYPYWEGANCQVMKIPPGTSPFIYHNSYYIVKIPGTSCPPPSFYDGANCHILPYPSWFTKYFVYMGNLYITPGPNNACPPPSSFDGANCYIMPLPWGSTPFQYAKRLYITPPPYCPVGAFDGANCYIGSAPASRTAFIWANYFYYHH